MGLRMMMMTIEDLLIGPCVLSVGTDARVSPRWQILWKVLLEGSCVVELPAIAAHAHPAGHTVLESRAASTLAAENA